MLFPFLAGEVTGLEAVAIGPSEGSFGVFIAVEVLVETP